MQPAIWHFEIQLLILYAWTVTGRVESEGASNLGGNVVVLDYANSGNRLVYDRPIR